MLFCGKYTEKVDNGKINVRHKMCGETYEIICADEPIGVTFVAVCTMESSFRAEIREHCEIRSEGVCQLNDTLVLPPFFVEYIGDSNVVVIGCGDRLEIYKEEEYVCPMPPKDAKRIADELLKKLEDPEFV